MKSLQTSLFFVAVLVVLIGTGSAWGVESSESIQGLIAHWKFDEGQGDIAYDSAGNNDGTVYGAQWTTGQINGALSFDGVDDYVYLGDIDEFEFGEDDFSISVWIYPRNHSGSGSHIITKYYWGNEQRQWWLAHMDSGVIGFYTNPTGASSDGEKLASVSPVAQNAWAFITTVRKGSTKYIYINGKLDTTGTTAGILTGQSAKVYIGAVDSPSEGLHNFFNGEIDDVRIYDKALSAEEIWQLYQGELADLVGLEIVGPGEVTENFSASYKAIAHYDDDSTRDVTDSALWAVEPNTHASIDENGVLRTKDIVTHQSATILASYMEGDVTFEAEKAIDILAICPTGTALLFDGVNDYVNLSENAITTTEFTIAAWANQYGEGGGVENQNIIFSQRDDDVGDNRPTIGLHADNGLSYAAAGIRSDSGSVQVLRVPKKDYNEWHHYAMTVDAVDFIFYIDAIEVGRTSNNQSGVYTTSVDHVYIGRRIFSSSLRGFFNGAIDDVRVYDRGLSSEEIQASMHTPLVGDEPGLVGYWDFDEGEGQIVYDLSGNGNDGQLGSTPEADSSDPAWVESDAPVGICSLYQIATMAADGAVECKTALLEELLAGLANEWTAYEALEELLESGDYGDLNYGDIVTAKQKINSATQHEEQSIGALEKSVEKLEDALSALGYEPDTAANIDGNGVLRTKDIVRDQSATILASYTEGDVTFEAEKAIDILAICPTGTALQFDGVDDYVEVSYHPVLNTNKITVLAWVKGSAQIFGRVVSHYEHGVEQRAWTMYSAGEGVSDKLKVVVSDNGQYSEPGHRKTYRTTTTAFDNTWRFVGFTFDGPNSNLKLYVDGTEDTNVTKIYDDPISEIYNSTAGLTIGCDLYYGAADYLFKGLIDEVAIYNRALSADEIRANMHRRLAGDEPNLVGYWDFDEGEGQIVYDLSGNGNDGQLGSTPEADSSDPAWVESDAPIGVCSLYQIATMAVDRAVDRKTAMLEELLAGLANEWTAYEALEELLESGDYGDLNYGDIVTAKQKINSATQHEEQSIGALEKSVEKLEDALSALGYEPPPPLPPPGQASNPNPANGATNVSTSADLNWTAGFGAVSHNVYFGTTSPGTFRGNQTATIFDPSSMAENTTYYWRIDEVNPSGTTTGTVWSFRTIGGGPGPPPGPPI